MVQLSTALGLLSAAALAQATTYTQTNVFDSSNFFTEFAFFNEADPTNGFVKYAAAADANAGGLAGFTNNSVYLGADHSTVTTAGRSSVRLTSSQSFTKGLFIADIAHMPVGSGAGQSCGLWPAFWMFGPNWPSSGEIDIIEGVNNQQSNTVTLHTSAGCQMTSSNVASGTTLTGSDCEGSSGCGQESADTSSYGSGFNAGGGGVYALEWTSDSITTWFLPRSDPTVAALASSSSAPDPTTFGTPLARFVPDTAAGGCDIDSHFANHNIVFNIDFCGDWAGQVFDQDDVCQALGATCADYVGQNPDAFLDAYWLINSVKVYQQAGDGTATKARRALRFDA